MVSVGRLLVCNDCVRTSAVWLASGLQCSVTNCSYAAAECR